MTRVSTPRGRATSPALLPVLLATTCLTCIGPAIAQDAADEEVVVTAQKREERLQNVPISIQALNSKKLEDLNITNFNDYVAYLPSVSFALGGGGGSPVGPGFATVTMRGVASGGDGNHSGASPTVGIYLDEQPVTNIGGAIDIHVYDVARVESLSGPQGTLYGASSEAGTIRIITNKPDSEEFSAAYDFELNSIKHGDVGYSAEGFVNIPLADNAAIRLVAWHEKAAGYIDNVPGTLTYPTSGITIDNDLLVEDDYNTVVTTGGRAALQIDLDENWTVTPSIIAQQSQTDGFFGFDPDLGELSVKHFVPEYAKDKWYQAALTIEGKISNLDVVYSGGHMGRTIDTAQDYTDYSFFYDTLYGYGVYSYDNDGNLIDPTQYINSHDTYSKDSHELRISTSADASLRFVGGLFFERQVHNIQQNYRIKNLADSISILPDQIWLTDQQRIDRDYAVFGELSYDVTDALTVTGGLRYYKYDNTLKGFFGFSDGFSSSTGMAACETPFVPFKTAPCVNVDKQVEDTGYTPKINVTYKIGEDALVYATWSRGYRPGGVNRRGTLPPYQSDELTNYEVGWKTSWDGGRLIVNGAAFWQDWENFQFSFLGLNSLTQIANGGDARIKGVELDIVWRPVEGLSLSGAATYTNARLVTNYCGVLDDDGNAVTECPGPLAGDPPQAPTGTRLPTTPEFKMNMIARYEFDVAPFLAHVQAAFTYQTGSAPDLRTNTGGVNVADLLGRMHAFTTLDVSAGAEWEGKRFELYIDNVTDERAELSNFATCNALVCGYNPYTVTNRPLTVGLKFGQSF